MLVVLRCLVFSGMIVLAAHSGCFAQIPEREQGPYLPKKIDETAKSQVHDDTSVPSKAPADSRTSPVRLKKIEEKMQQVNAFKQNKAVENQAIEHFQQGESLYREGKTKEAQGQWMQAIELSKDPEWMKRTIDDTKRKVKIEARQKKLADKELKKKQAIEEKQKKKLENIKKKNEKQQQKLVNFNKKEKKFFPLNVWPFKKKESEFKDLSTPPRGNVGVQ